MKITQEQINKLSSLACLAYNTELGRRNSLDRARLNDTDKQNIDGKRAWDAAVNAVITNLPIICK